MPHHLYTGRLGGVSSNTSCWSMTIPINQFFGRELLQTFGVTVSVAASGADAIQQIQQQNFTLVFMDVSMPEMDGYETTRRIRTDPRFSDLPIVALTAHAIAGERERCLAAGMNDYLTKPLELEQLRAAVYQRAASATPAHSCNNASH